MREDGNRIIRLNYDGIFEEISPVERARCRFPPYITERLNVKPVIRRFTQKKTDLLLLRLPGCTLPMSCFRCISEKGIDIVDVLLHVGLGTFRPVSVENVEEHHMHSEHYECTQDAADRINRARANGGRIIAVGTTSCRTLESITDENGIVHPGSGSTDIFITPGYRFKAVMHL